MSDESLEDQINALLPKRLDEIIRKNRDKVCLEYVRFEDLSKLKVTFPITNNKGVITDAFLYKFVGEIVEKDEVFLVGFRRNHTGESPYHTTHLIGIDFESNVVLTNSGSNYIIKNFVEGEPHLSLLLHICYVAHLWGWGKYFDVPYIEC